MKKLALVVNYFIFIVLFALMFLQTTGAIELTKYLLLLLSTYLLFQTTIKKNITKSMYFFNYLFLTSTTIYILYGLFFKGILFVNITVYFIVAAIIGFGLSLSLKEKKEKKITFRAPKQPKTTKTVKKATKKKVAKKTTKKVSAKKTVKKVTKKPIKKKTTKKATKKKVAKKTSKKVSAKKTTKKSARSKAMDAKLISMEEHEMKTVLRKFNKRTTKDNVKKLRNITKTFKANPKNAPRNRENFYKFLKTNKTFKKLQ